MDAPPRSASSTPGILHHIPPVSAFEPQPASTSPSNLLLWIGGLFNTYHDVDYPYTLSSRLPPSWSLAQVSLTSAGTGWGIRTLDDDVREISSIVQYFRRTRKGKIVLMGHSTGCQDSMHYATSADPEGKREKVDGIILQAPASDSEALQQELPAEQLERTNALAKEWLDAGKGDDCLPQGAIAGIFGNGAIMARRWLSLSSPEGKGQDDYFSSYLGDERLRGTFGEVKVPLLVLFGAKDQFVPAHVDKKGMVGRWVKVMRDCGRTVDAQSEMLLEGASHNLNGDPEEVVDELCRRVNVFLETS